MATQMANNDMGRLLPRGKKIWPHKMLSVCPKINSDASLAAQNLSLCSELTLESLIWRPHSELAETLFSHWLAGGPWV